ncbi:zinc finger CCCH domain-containing protein 7B-like isoform X1 [Myxocyprinus asiaticus]|uniref:zinc finger CCCH domain-containing protein 7B-like isoform X1 n=1 Tax=Myxocyprinus asiaticus TaxID=70543 RepID=UPI0022239324|nr:zinc finger CCCH domain-containing protein 7B-like isoform X1 [Myxocyprinus asiaticus]XP_051522857.1 zinc finger CCCH domain-containing protein 7B-like isoform X1 [Myxocyprinus asiaticus]
MDPERQKRKEEIQKSLGFIQSSLPFPEPEGYEAFLTQLVCNLLDEGNAVFRDGEWRQAAVHYSEGVNVSRYAQSEALVIPQELLESLYVNRAAAHYNLGEFERGVQDCDSALCVSEGSRRALYRKALCLRELGRLREAYECGTGCLLTAPHDRQVSELAQDLANKLGLKIRKAYVSPQIDSTTSGTDNSGETNSPKGETSSNGLESLTDIDSDLTSAQCIPAPLATPIPVSDDPQMPTLSPVVPQDMPESPSQEPSGRVPYSVPVSEHMGECVMNEECLETLLESIPKGAEVSVNPVQGAIPTNLPNTAVGLRPPYSPGLPASSSQLTTTYFNSAVSSLTPLESFSVLSQSEASSQTMDSLGSFSSGAGTGDTGGKTVSGSLSTGGLDSLSEYTLPGGRISHSFIPGLRNHNATNAVSLISSIPNGPAGTNLSLLSRNPLTVTHEFRQACNACYSRVGPRVMDYHYQPDAAHRCKRDVLLCRLKSSDDSTWKRVRPRPARNNFLGAFVLCKEVQERQECQYGENCTFAYCQEEIDVWTQERKGALSRELLFDPLGTNERRALSVTRLLQLHMGMFMFLCEECFDSKPRIISKRSKENLAVCSNLTARHPFDDNKCLVHVVRSANVRYSKVRPLHPLCQFDVCRHEVRYGCQREDSCSFAHSVIELKCWVLQQDTGITHEEMVQESKRHWHRLEQNAQRQKPMLGPHHPTSISSNSSAVVSGGGDNSIGGGLVGCGRGRGLNLKLKFVCGQCWREGQVNEPDKSLKYCTAKARHSWTKERRVLLVKSFEKKKWVVVRPLPFSRTYPQQYDMCVHVMKQKKCHYIGNCSFAHSLEERDVWTYMKNNSLRDMQQMYEMWLSLTNQNRRTDSTHLTPPLEEKQIAMPTDYSESMVGRRLSGGGGDL